MFSTLKTRDLSLTHKQMVWSCGSLSLFLSIIHEKLQLYLPRYEVEKSMTSSYLHIIWSFTYAHTISILLGWPKTPFRLGKTQTNFWANPIFLTFVPLLMLFAVWKESPVLLPPLPVFYLPKSFSSFKSVCLFNILGMVETFECVVNTLEPLSREMHITPKFAHDIRF